MISGRNAIEPGWGTSDDNGHGTHVAGILGGSIYGIAKGVTIVPVKCVDYDGVGTSASVISGINWAVRDKRVSNKRKVINLSIGSDATDTALDKAVAAAYTAGVVIVVAASNDAGNACNFSPARVPVAITVGATDKADNIASYSNGGSCVDIFAPGTRITSSWWTTNSATKVLDGRSLQQDKRRQDLGLRWWLQPAHYTLLSPLSALHGRPC